MGPGAEAWLNALFANRMPTEIGRSCLTPLIGKRGGIAGDFTVTKLADDEFRVFGSGMAERFHQRFFKAVPLPEGTTFRSRTEDLCGFNVAGPKSRELLQRLTNADLSTEAFPFMRSRQITVAGVDVVALRVSFTGDLGWELYCPAASQVELYSACSRPAEKSVPGRSVRARLCRCASKRAMAAGAANIRPNTGRRRSSSIGLSKWTRANSSTGTPMPPSPTGLRAMS
ncbi:hypothetical protein AJ88_11270 [Mesorhizobium amorphae CCBAU 01583]|nr:hypothetical protein AJ88_11270 [Mesorhizobium amorphae CCBAU 01583]